MSPLVASRSMRLIANHPIIRPAAKKTICSAIRAAIMLEYWSILLVLISNSPAEISVKTEPMNMSSPIRFSRRCCRLSVGIGEIARDQLNAKVARLSITMKLLAGTTSAAFE